VCVSAPARAPPLNSAPNHPPRLTRPRAGSTASTDQTAQFVLKNLMKSPEFSSEEGWHMCVWSRTLELNIKGTPTQVSFKRNYLKHDDGRVVWAQHKAYMDSAGAQPGPAPPPRATPS